MSIDSRNVVNLRNGRFDSTTRTQLDALFDAFRKDGTGNLAVHFHGGLVKEAGAMSMADRLLPVYRQDGVAYPVFFVWETGLLETLRNNVGDILQEGFFQKLLKRALAFVAGKVFQTPGEKGISVTPAGGARVAEEIEHAKSGEPSWTDLDPARRAAASELSELEAKQFKDTLEGDPGFVFEAQKIANSILPPDLPAQARGLETGGSTTTLMSPDVLADVARERAPGAGAKGGILGAARLVKGAITVVARVISRFRAQRDHGVHATVVEEIFREFYVSAVGREIWGQMKKDTADAFQANGAIFGGTAFLAKLADEIVATPNLRVTLIGHSAGSEYVCNMLAHADDALPAGFQFDVVLMAPACRTEFFADVLAHHGARVRDFRCFTMEDAREKADRLVPAIYPHSLLYFISGVLEDESDKPILGMERFLTGSAPRYDQPQSHDGRRNARECRTRAYLTHGHRRSRRAESRFVGIAGPQSRWLTGGWL